MLSPLRNLLIGVWCLTSLACASPVEDAHAGAAQGLSYDAYYTATPGGDPRILMWLQRRVEWLGIDVVYVAPDSPDLRGATGLSWHDGNGRHILVNQSLSVNGQLEVLAHEAAHLYQPSMPNRGDNEVFAEAVSVLVCQNLGIDVAVQSSRYLQAFKSSFSVTTTHKHEIAYVTYLLSHGFR